MSGSRTRSGLAVVALTCLGAITSGCVWPATARVFPACERVCVESSSTVVMRPAAEQPPTERPRLREDLPGPIADVPPHEVLSIEPPALRDVLPDEAPVIEPPALRDVSPSESPAQVPLIEPSAPPDIAATPSALTLKVFDLVDPAPKAEKLTYQIVVLNNGTAAEQNVAVEVTLPYEMVPVLTDTVGPGGRTITGQTIRFDPLVELRPGGRSEYQVVVRARQSGQLTVRAQLTSDRLPQPLDAEATTEVLP